MQDWEAIISIHAPREGSDQRGAERAAQPHNFYPRSPRGERPGDSFLGWMVLHHFYPRSPRGERLHCSSPQRKTLTISIHAPREGSDRVRVIAASTSAQFLSTLPARGATNAGGNALALIANFYPRSPRGERPGRPGLVAAGTRFLSTLPARGATGLSALVETQTRKFLSTLPARGATTVWVRRTGGCRPISIHAPREGSDSKCAEK